ncbi:type I DNA topoisomerase [bacterium]|jgi:DNA topoisomerase I|nr:type I DNA topoisomerase [bacterium]MBT4251514.1 type I DNA topoisomerase [bacterium]MBT4597488.1 type I DNA topoisomerase [bacterium]MBT6754327.1 type I DNA topoisomerase [bacterium]MBT7037653.1 type I DNA topoisomerase [bacterium]
MKLMIVESPAKAKTISKYLDNKYTVRASVGHVRDLPKSNKKAIDFENGFAPSYEISEGKEQIVAEISELAKKATEVVLATDPDREGEAIAWHIAEAVGLKDPKRVTFNEITQDAVSEAMKHPRKIDMNLKEAQETRRVLDRLFGYDLSGLIWKKVRYGLSAGRVQSPALRIIMEREREIRAFNSHIYWIITALLLNKNKELLQLTCKDEPINKDIVKKIVSAGKKQTWTVTDIKETSAKRSPRAPFITSTLQQAASSRFGFPPSKTMSVAQKLYEAGHITYMRTDSTNLSAVAKNQIKKILVGGFGEEYYTERFFGKKSKSAQEAHEAIRPSDLKKRDCGNAPDQKKLYDLIWRRTVASQASDAKTLRTKIVVSLEDKTLPIFFVNGSRVLFDGWYRIDTASRGDDVEVPKVVKGEELNFQRIETEEKETQPPNRYSEAGLIKELEKRGIGRPSTYAPTLQTLKNRGYVEKIGSALTPTDTGDVVSSFVEENFADYISDSFTAEMEDKLDKISEGKENYEKTLKKFYTPFTKDIASKEKMEKITTLGDADAKYKCPECGGKMVIKLGKNGKFISCAKFPDCSGALTIEGKKIQGPKILKEKCPKCDNFLVEKEGRFGKFIACSNYPKCKFIKNDPKEEAKKKTGVECPECKKGDLMERKGRFGVFYSCSNYPDCKYAIKAKPTGRICKFKRDDKGGEICGALMMEGTKTIPERCSDKLCPNHNPHKLEK